MRANQEELLRRSKEFKVGEKSRRPDQIRTMIAEFHRMCIDLGQEIAAEEMRAKVFDPTHFTYPTYSTAERERRARLERSVEVPDQSWRN